MSYNVLCDKFATRQQYGYCPTWALAWEYRKSALIKEIQDGGADIIALQVSLVAMKPSFHSGERGGGGAIFQSAQSPPVPA